MPPEETKTPDVPESVPEAPTPAVETPAEMPAPVPETPQPEMPPVENTAGGEEPTAPTSPTETITEAKPTPHPPEPERRGERNEPQASRSVMRSLADKARTLIQFRKQKKLEKVMNLFSTKPQITNDEVEKLLHISDATATRYLTQLKREGKIIQVGKTGTGVKYQKL